MLPACLSGLLRRHTLARLQETPSLRYWPKMAMHYKPPSMTFRMFTIGYKGMYCTRCNSFPEWPRSATRGQQQTVHYLWCGCTRAVSSKVIVQTIFCINPYKRQGVFFLNFLTACRALAEETAGGWIRPAKG